MDNEVLALIIGGLLVAGEAIVKLTPTKKDDNIFSVVSKVLLFFIPNRKKGGGKH